MRRNKTRWDRTNRLDAEKRGLNEKRWSEMKLDEKWKAELRQDNK